MSRVEAAAGMDRLPWLPDEPKPQPARRARTAGNFVGWAGAAVVLVAGTAYWFGAASIEQTPPAPASKSQTATTVRLPAPHPSMSAQPQVRLVPAPEVEPIVAPPMPVIDEPRPLTRARQTVVTAPRAVARPALQTSPEPAKAELPQPWPVRVIEGASGRLVRVGAFSTVHRAKRGWWAVVRMNPALKRLPALVVPVRSLRNGRVYYRLQMGTTSQAHSAVLCQRMRMIAQPCVVIGMTPAVR